MMFLIIPLYFHIPRNQPQQKIKSTSPRPEGHLHLPRTQWDGARVLTDGRCNHRNVLGISILDIE